MDTKEIKIKLHDGGKMPEQKKGGDWVDLYTSQKVVLKKGEWGNIPLGVSIELPEGYEAELAPRSSTFKHYGIFQTNSIGVIDESYCGDDDMWQFPAYALMDTEIKAGERICQFRIREHQPKLTFTQVETLGNESRGGFGSTGRR